MPCTLRRSLCPLLIILLGACQAEDPPAPSPEPNADAGLGGSALAGESGAAVADAPASARFVLGTHYGRLSPVQPTGSGPDRVEVGTLFSYGNPASFGLEAELERWRARLPAFIALVRIPAVRNELERLHARAYYAAEALGRGEALHAVLYRELQEGGNPLDTRAAVAAAFARSGVDAEEFDGAFDSYEVHAKVQWAEELTRRYRIAAVPAVVVNGKYTSNVELAGGPAELLALAEFLAGSERALR